MSTTAPVSPKTTPPASPKTQPAKDTKPPATQKIEEKKPEKPQQDKTSTKVQAKVDKTPSVPPQAPADTQGAPKADQSICPLCKVELNMGSKDPPNYNTCTECKTTVCNLCGFNPMPNMAEVKEWLCLNCQMQRALGASEPTGPSVKKPQPSPSKVEQKDMPASVQEKSTESTAVKKEVTQATPLKKEIPKPETPLPAVVKMAETSQQGSMQKKPDISGTEKGQAQDVAGQQQLVGKQVQLPQTTKPEVKAVLTKQEAVKPPQQPLKSATPPAKSAPPPAQPAKQESGGFFGFGVLKHSRLQQSLLTVQDEPKTTPPTPRKMSTTVPVSSKPTPPVSPKMPPAKETRPPATQKSEPPQQPMPAPSAQAKVEKAPPEPSKPLEVTQVTPKADLSICPLCKVELNMGSKDSPNYNTCTACKNTVCNLCGFNPMPHTAA
ncbi:protein bassoon-like, partial [Lates calcarifer]|uniref:Protein bassoon-like n=1 Tax=Lates calcarifer TaxID=8187 RepID=A0AAJ7VDW7_LATCA